jgi:hypothetical protein
LDFKISGPEPDGQHLEDISANSQPVISSSWVRAGFVARSNFVKMQQSRLILRKLEKALQIGVNAKCN